MECPGSIAKSRSAPVPGFGMRRPPLVCERPRRAARSPRAYRITCRQSCSGPSPVPSRRSDQGDRRRPALRRLRCSRRGEPGAGRNHVGAYEEPARNPSSSSISIASSWRARRACESYFPLRKALASLMRFLGGRSSSENIAQIVRRRVHDPPSRVRRPRLRHWRGCRNRFREEEAKGDCRPDASRSCCPSHRLRGQLRAAADMQDIAGDERRSVRGEERDGSGNVLGSAEPFERRDL